MCKLTETHFESTWYSVADVRGMDRAAIDEKGIPGYTLMTRAAEAGVDLARQRFPGRERWVFLCGGGNNAGDGYVMARLAQASGIAVTTHWLSDPSGLAGDAATAYRDFIAAGLVVTRFEESMATDAELIIDAMLGSGLERAVTGRYRQAVEWANRQSASIVALDIPTGLNGDTGEIMGAAINADLTVTFVGLKAGLVLGAGPDHTGDTVLADLAIPEDCRAQAVGVVRAMDESAIFAAMAPRPRDTHKGRHGHVLIIGGAPGMSGAVRIAGEAALRSGAGMVSILTHPDHAASLNHGRPELMVSAASTASDAAPLMTAADVIAIGPGLGHDDWARSLLDAALASEKPLVIDADGLTLLAKIGTLRADAILTPHPGEAARLLGVSPAAIQADRLAALSRLAQKYPATVVLKGAGTLISAAEGLPWICTDGNPGMASAGMGDALTGIVASLRGQGLAREAAAVVATTVHARAGDVAARDGARGLLAMDLVNNLRAQVNP